MRFLRLSYATRVSNPPKTDCNHDQLQASQASLRVTSNQLSVAGIRQPQLFVLTFGVLAAILFFFSLTGSSQAAVSPSPGWTLDSVPTPTHFFSSPSEDKECEIQLGSEVTPCDGYEVTAANAGSLPTSGPVTLTDTLPPGVTIKRVTLYLVENTTSNKGENGGTTVGVWPVNETRYAGDCSASAQSAQCTFSGVLAPDDWLLLHVYVTVNPGVAQDTRLTNRATVSGGGATAVSASSENEVNQAPAPFGPSRFQFFKDGANGLEERQAGGHLYELTTTIDLNNELRNGTEIPPGKSSGVAASVEDVKDIVVDLPLGFAGSTLAAPECTEAQLISRAHCPPDTAVGHLTTEPVSTSFENTTINSPIYNLVPEHGHPAEFGYVDLLKNAHVAGYVSVVPTPAGYVLRFVAAEIPEVNLARIVVTFYGDPALRDAEAQQHELEEKLGTTVPLQVPTVQVPFFTNPTACPNGSQEATIWMDSWPHPASFQPGGLIPTNLEEPQWKKMTSVSPPVSGCDQLQFTPQIGSQPTTHKADEPSGLEFEQRLPQTEQLGVPATPALKDTTIVFPAGMTVDPSSADGLGTCSLAQIGWQGHAPAQPGELYDFTQGPPECPESSKIGTLELETPLIPGVLHGEVFLAAQNENPFDSVFATYIVVNDPTTGVVLKLAGEVKLCASAGEIVDGRACQAAGQITSTFDETPQLPFSDLKVHFFGGPRAEFATPPNCGLYTTNSELTPWSAPDSGLSPTPFDSYVIDEDCAIGFNPSFAALTTNVQAGGYTAFEGSFSREDSDQELQGLTMNLPPGLLANVASVPECGEAEVKAEENDAPGGCPAATQVGTVVAEAGPGPNPLAVPGKIFFTGPYNGGPYGLAVVVSANPGPFHFGNVVVRQSLRIDPYDAHVTDVSDTFPTFIDPKGANGDVNGIPIKLRRVNFAINRPGFTFNPTSCSKLQVSGAITSVHGATSNLAAPFQAGECQNLAFAPKVAFSTNGKTSKADGADLITKVSYPSGPQGTYADVGYVKVELPKALPSRLTTLQKACTNAQFEANPAACPAASKIGFATVHTPILPGVLQGPAIFVSHGGEAFPSLTMVLQGDGVTIDLVGTTFISKSGITSTTFKAVPDSPFATFELVLPQGPFSALAANGNLCNQKLVMPNEFRGQNGAVVKQSSTVNVEGCKPAITVVGHKVKGKVATIQVSVPAAGKLVASGKGLIAPSGAAKATKTTTSATGATLTVKLTLSKAEVAFLNRHHAKRLKSKINLTFTPKKGGKLKATTTVFIG
jgi:uncharacterized repeat protein (TIGR01451 family)